MNWNSFLEQTRDMPLIITENLRTPTQKSNTLELQLSRWKRARRLVQLKRGVYLLGEPYRRRKVYELFIAQSLKTPSYISLEKALELHGLIPEGVPTYTSVTPKRQARFETPLGVFSYRHIQTSLFWGYEPWEMEKQIGFVAVPEKALLDLVYLNDIHVTADYLRGLRLQNTRKINPGQLLSFAKRFNKPLILEAAKKMKRL